MAKHGGLSKAGKVRKQTPKVPKMDRKFKPTVGRAKMRKKYVKRFYFMKETKQKNYNTQKTEWFNYKLEYHSYLWKKRYQV